MSLERAREELAAAGREASATLPEAIGREARHLRAAVRELLETVEELATRLDGHESTPLDAAHAPF